MAAESVSMTMQVTSQSEDKTTRSITNINPEASDGQLSKLAKALNAITTNTLGTVNRVEKREIVSGNYITPEIDATIVDDSELGAITQEGETLNFTIDKSKLGDTYDITEMQYIILTNKTSSTLNDNLTYEVTGTPMRMTVEYAKRDSFNVTFYKDTGMPTGTATLTIHWGKELVNPTIAKFTII